MKTVGSVLLAMLAGSAAASPSKIPVEAPRPQTELSAVSAPNAVSMSTLKVKKLEQFERDAAAGVYDLDAYTLQGATACSNGTAGEYKCHNVDLKGFLRHQDLHSRTRAGNDVWGKS